MKLYDVNILRLGSFDVNSISEFHRTELAELFFNNDWIPKLGFQQLSIAEHKAAILCEYIMRNKGYAFVLNVDYRDRKISENIAKKNAEEVIQKIISLSYPNYEFDDIQLVEDNGYFRKYIRTSLKLQNENVIPGAIFVNVDNYDGHVFSKVEETQLFFEDYFIDFFSSKPLVEYVDKLSEMFSLEKSTDYFDNNRECLRKNGLLFIIKPHPFAGLIKNKWGLNVNLWIQIRAIKHQRDSEIAIRKALQIAVEILKEENTVGDFLLSTDRFFIDPIVVKKGGKVCMNMNNNHWKESLNLFDMIPYSIGKIEFYS